MEVQRMTVAIPDPRYVRLSVERGRVREFRLATASAHADASSAPPTFPSMLDLDGPTSSDLMEEMGYDLLHVLHGEEALEFHGKPLQPGDELKGMIRVDGIEHKTGRSGPLELVRFRIELARPDGTPAVVICRTLVSLQPPRSS
jgi:hypothetical protein